MVHSSRTGAKLTTKPLVELRERTITSEMKDRRQRPAFRDGDSRRLNKSNGAASERAGGRHPRSKEDGKRRTGGSGKKGRNADDPPTIGIRDRGLCLSGERHRRGETRDRIGIYRGLSRGPLL